MYDIIIAGAGPSGSSAARVAARAGLKTLLIEKESFPRYKPCGGAVSKQAMNYIDFKIPKSIIEKNIYGARIHFGGKSIEKHKEEILAALVVRSKFDELLMKEAAEAGAEIRQNEKVLSYKEIGDTAVEVKTSKAKYKTKFFLIAEGAHGNLKLNIRKRDKKSEFGICTVTEIEEKPEKINKYIKDAIDVHFGVAELGYGWIFPLKNHYSVGIGGIADKLNDPLKIMNDFLKENHFNGKYKLRSHLIPAGGIPRKIISSRVALVGDSAGFVDSFTGEGIAYAIRSGQLAAESIYEIIRDKKEISYLKNYEKRAMTEFGNDLKYSLFVSKIMHYFPNLFFKFFTSNEELIDKYLDVSSLKITYKSFFLWMIPRVPAFLLKTILS